MQRPWALRSQSRRSTTVPPTGVNDGKQHVDFPASSPFALACGGTNIKASGSQISVEQVWNELAANEGATGGGVSTIFEIPDYQKNAGVPANVDTRFPGRGVPDVSGDADPETGYIVRVDGKDTVIGGTSEEPHAESVLVSSALVLSLNFSRSGEAVIPRGAAWRTVAGEGKVRVLDLAAGHVLFGITIAQRNPQAHITALDWPNVLAVASENATNFGVADRHSLLAGDAFVVEFGGPFSSTILIHPPAKS